MMGWDTLGQLGALLSMIAGTSVLLTWWIERR